MIRALGGCGAFAAVTGGDGSAPACTIGGNAASSGGDAVERIADAGRRFCSGVCSEKKMIVTLRAPQ